MAARRDGRVGPWTGSERALARKERRDAAEWRVWPNVHQLRWLGTHEPAFVAVRTAVRLRDSARFRVAWAPPSSALAAALLERIAARWSDTDAALPHDARGLLARLSAYVAVADNESQFAWVSGGRARFPEVGDQLRMADGRVWYVNASFRAVREASGAVRLSAQLRGSVA